MLVCSHKSKLAFTELETKREINLPVFVLTQSLIGDAQFSQRVSQGKRMGSRNYI